MARAKRPVRRATKGHKKKTRKLKKKVAKTVISQRGRFHPMAAPSPGMPIGPQNIFTASTVIKSFKYKKGTLRIFFQSGHVYDYFDVEPFRVTALANAPSKGRYFYYNIRTSYTYRRIK